MINLITGGAGFIGSNLAKYLINIGENVIVFDDLSTGDIINLKSIQNSPNFKFIEDTILNNAAIESAIREADIIYHLAAAVGVDYVCNNHEHTEIINIKGTENIVKYSSKYNKRLLFTSSSEVYLNSNQVPFSEEDASFEKESLNLLNIYGKTKIIGEKIINTYKKEQNLNAIIIRLFNVGGYGQKYQYGMVIPKFVKCAILNKPIEIYGDGKQTRTFIHVQDVINSMIFLINKNFLFEKAFNIGGTKEVSIIQLAKEILKLIKSSSSIEFFPYEKTVRKNYKDFKRRIPDTSLARKHMALSESYNLDKIIMDTSKYIIETEHEHNNF
jgi:UDP-glucose 4-epimerase